MGSIANSDLGKQLPATAVSIAAGMLVGSIGAALAYLLGPVVPLVLLCACVFAVLIATRPMLALHAALLSVPFELFAFDLGAASLSVTELMLVATGGGWASLRLAQGHLPLSRSPLTLPLTALVVALVPGITIAIDPSATMKAVVMWTSFLLVCEMISSEAREKDVHITLLVLSAVAGIVGLWAAVESGGSLPELRGMGDTAVGRAEGPLGHPNTLATLAVLALPASVVLGLSAVPAMRLVAGASAMLILVALALSLSRSGLFAAAGALLVLLVWAPFRRVALMLAIAVVAIAAVSGDPLSETEAATVLKERVSSVGYSAQGVDPRFQVWTASRQMVVDHPFLGIGATNYPVIAQRYGLIGPASQTRFEHAHNIPLTIAVELGLVGLAALAWAAIALARMLLRGIRNEEGTRRNLLIAIAASFVALSLQGMVDYTLRSNIIVAVIFILAGCAAVLTRPADQRDPATSR